MKTHMKTHIFLGASIALYAMTSLADDYEEEGCISYEGRSEARRCVEFEKPVETTNQLTVTPEEKEAETENNSHPSPVINEEELPANSEAETENNSHPSPVINEEELPANSENVVIENNGTAEELPTKPETVFTESDTAVTEPPETAVVTNLPETVPNSLLSEPNSFSSYETQKQPIVVPDAKTQPGVLTIIDMSDNCDPAANLTLMPSNNSHVADNKDGTLTYVSNRNMNGFDEFYYTCEKDGKPSTNKVIVEVRADDRNAVPNAVPIECSICVLHHQEDSSRLLTPIVQEDNTQVYPLTEIAPLPKGINMVGFDCQPQSGECYAMSGISKSYHPAEAFDGDLWEVNTQEVKFQASTGYSNITAMAFHQNGVLYVWSTNGMVKIEISKKTAHANLLISAEELFGRNVEITSLAWSFDGTALYASEKRNLWVLTFDGDTFEKKKKCTNLPKKEVSLETSENGVLLTSFDQKGDFLSVSHYDPENCQVIQTPLDTNSDTQEVSEEVDTKIENNEEVDTNEPAAIMSNSESSEDDQQEVDNDEDNMSEDNTSDAYEPFIVEEADEEKAEISRLADVAEVLGAVLGFVEQPLKPKPSENTPKVDSETPDELAAEPLENTHKVDGETLEELEEPAAEPSDDVDTSENEANEKPVGCPIYAVHDEGESDSQFLIIEKPYWEQGVREFGPLHKRYNIEALEMDPQSGQLYAISNKTHKSRKFDGILHKVDLETGKLKRVGDTGYSGITALTFCNGGLLFGASTFGAKDGSKKAGIVSIDPETAHTEWLVSIPKKPKIASLACNDDGTMLYATEKNDNLWAIDLLKLTFKIQCSNLPEIEGLETLKDGKLLFAIHQADHLWFVSYDPKINTDPDNCMLGITEYFAKTEKPYDVESIVWPLSCQKTLKETIIDFLALKMAEILGLENVRLEKSGEGAFLFLKVAGQVHQGYFPQLLSLNEIKPNCGLTFTVTGDVNNDGYDDLEMHYGNDLDANCGPVQTLPLHYLGIKEVKGEE